MLLILIERDKLLAFEDKGAFTFAIGVMSLQFLLNYLAYRVVYRLLESMESDPLHLNEVDETLHVIVNPGFCLLLIGLLLLNFLMLLLVKFALSHSVLIVILPV